MTYVIGERCIDVMDPACVEECPVDCIYEGGHWLYIHPDECVEGGACKKLIETNTALTTTVSRLATQIRDYVYADDLEQQC